MIRAHAEHLLDAYMDMEKDGGNDKARQSLREVILDAMTSYHAAGVPNIIYDPPTKPFTTPGIWDYHTHITCDGGGVTTAHNSSGGAE